MVSAYTSAMQHTRAMIALVLASTLTDLSATPSKTFQQKIAKLKTLLDVTFPPLQQHRVSAAANRIFKQAFTMAHRELPEVAEVMSGKMPRNEYAASVEAATMAVTAATFITDAAIVCPVWAHGRAWYDLDRLATSIMRFCIAQHPEAEERGTELYIKIAEAMEAAA